MDFTGHNVYRINNNWLFDITTLRGYKVTRNKRGVVTGYIESYIFTKQDEHDDIHTAMTKSAVTTVGTATRISSHIINGCVPFGVIRKSVQLIEVYSRRGDTSNG